MISRFASLLLCVSPCVSASGQQQPDELPKDEKSLTALVTKREKELTSAREQFKRGVASVAEVDVATIDLHEAKIALATVSGNQQEILPSLKEVVGAWDRILKRMLRNAAKQGETESNIDTVTRALAEAKLRVAKINGDEKEMVRELEKIVGAAEREFKRTEDLFKKRTATKIEMDRVRKVLDDAKRRLAELKGT